MLDIISKFLEMRTYVSLKTNRSMMNGKVISELLPSVA